MGLAMFLKGEKFHWNPPKGKNGRTEDGFPVSQVELDLGHWRSRHHLHNFIFDEFGDHEGEDCQEIELSVYDMRTIIDAIRNKGISSPKCLQKDVAIFEAAIRWLEGGDSGPATEIKDDDDGGMVIMEIKNDTTGAQRVSREVVYQAAW